MASRHFVTNVSQFRALSGADFVTGCDFRLTGVITLMDTNRDLIVLQDSTGAVALNFPFEGQPLSAGHALTLEGSDCSPYNSAFPDFPYRPSGWEICPSFEAPEDWGEYNLTRMRGYLHPTVSGEYSFWIASDNSSELWLSENSDPSRSRKIAFIPRYGWVAPRDWSHLVSQHSVPVVLKAGETYYIEALNEQTRGGQHLSVAWQGPGVNQSIIESSHLTPWSHGDVKSTGILREYWTNYSNGDLEGLAGTRGFESALSVNSVRVSDVRAGQLPDPLQITVNQPLLPEDNYRWVQVEGVVRFTSVEEGMIRLELTDGQGLIQVRVSGCTPDMAPRLRNALVRIEGVCEGSYDQKGTMRAGLVWTCGDTNISFIETLTANTATSESDQPATATSPPSATTQGFYGTRGVVTFNDRVLDNDYIFIQDNVAVQAKPQTPSLISQFKVGHWVDMAGALESGRLVPAITPLVVKDLGWHAMPVPIVHPIGHNTSPNREGRWCELEGVVRSCNSNRTLSLIGKDGHAYLWIGQTTTNELARYVDARLRARGVLILSLLDAPVLLVPSPNSIDVEKSAPKTPFDAPKHLVSDLFPEKMDSSWFHRARVQGEVTYQDAQSFFIQDGSGGIRVRTSHQTSLKAGDVIEVAAFPVGDGFGRSLSDALVRPARMSESVKAVDLDLSEAFSPGQVGTLVNASATLLTSRTNGAGQVLDLQEQQRVFLATLAVGQGVLPDITPGSRVRVTGVYGDDAHSSSQADDKFAKAQFPPSLNILLRSPEDVVVLSGPPWWTLKRTVTLVGALLVVLAVALLWVHLLRRRLERQQAAQLAFSRQVLERLEDERRRIAVNLHDSLGQILLAIKNHALLGIQRPPDDQGMKQRLGEISGITSQAIDEVRQITHGLRPYQLDRLGLTQAIRASVGWATDNHSIQFASRVEDIDGLFDKDAEIHIYRIVQEAVTNVVKHSQATEATVVIKKRPTAVSLSIRDNGKGFDPAKLFSQPHTLGYGLSGIAERVRILGGTLNTDSHPGEGASLTIEVPLPVFANDTRSDSIDRG